MLDNDTWNGFEIMQEESGEGTDEIRPVNFRPLINDG